MKLKKSTLSNEGNPICEILDPDGPFQFEEGLVALLEKPEMMEYLIFREYEMKLDSINHLGAEVLLVEEPKKGYALDIMEIRKALDQSITLFGNIDSIYTLLKGNPNDVAQEVRRQSKASRYGSFVIANGSPLLLTHQKKI